MNSLYLPELGHKLDERFSDILCPGLKTTTTVKITGTGTVKACVNQCVGCQVPKSKRSELCMVGKKLLEAYIHA